MLQVRSLVGATNQCFSPSLPPSLSLFLKINLKVYDSMVLVYYSISFLYCNEMYATKFAILSVQFSGIKYIHNVLPSPATSRTFVSQT